MNVLVLVFLFFIYWYSESRSKGRKKGSLTGGRPNWATARARVSEHPHTIRNVIIALVVLVVLGLGFCYFHDMQEYKCKDPKNCTEKEKKEIADKDICKKNWLWGTRCDGYKKVGTKGKELNVPTGFPVCNLSSCDKPEKCGDTGYVCASNKPIDGFKASTKCKDVDDCESKCCAPASVTKAKCSSLATCKAGMVKDPKKVSTECKGTKCVPDTDTQCCKDTAFASTTCGKYTKCSKKKHGVDKTTCKNDAECQTTCCAPASKQGETHH